MTSGISGWYAERITAHSKLVILAVLALTVLVAAGATMGDTEEEELGEFEVDSPETDAQDFVDANYGSEDTNVVAQLVVRDEGGDVLSRDSLLEGLRLQQAAQNDDAIDATLTEQGFVGIENIVATAAVAADSGGGPPPTGTPTLEAQIEALENRNEAEVEQLLAEVLDPDSASTGEQDPYEFLPLTYTPGETRADARLTLVTQVDESGKNEVPQAAYDAQVAIADQVDDRFDDAFVFGQGIQDDASARATGDSFAIITPFALVLILFVLGVTYRDPLDILLAFLGIGVVLVWVGGIMGWLAIPMNVILISVPFLLIGLSIDYALHVVMRYREARAGTLGNQDGGEEPGDGGSNGEGPGNGEAEVAEAGDGETAGGDGDTLGTPEIGIRTAMALGFGSVVLALGAATFSTGVGFLSNVVSPLPAIQDFAVLSAGGILATFVAFGVLLPALKVEVDSFVENRLGRSRRKPAFGVESGRVNSLLARFGSLTTRIPFTIILVALLLAAGGLYGGATLDTEFNEADFLPQNAPEFAQQLPGPLEPGTYTIAEDFDYLSENFQVRGEGGQSEILIRGNVTDESLLRALDSAGTDVDTDSAIQIRPDGRAAVDGPHTVIRETANENESFGTLVAQSDTTGDGLPDENVSAIYRRLFEADEEAAATVLSRGDDGEITSARLILSVRSGESAQTIADDTRTFASKIEGNAAGISAVATGATVTTAVIQDALLETLVGAFGVTLAVIFVFLTALFWVRYRSWSQGALTLTPVLISLAWLLGTMSLFDIPLNSETAVITSLAIGLGVDYSIHAGERFMEEREHRDTLEQALQSTVTGTGGALLASAATTAAGFGVLALALSPPLQRFGIVTGSAILFAFFAVVTILPGLLVIRERLLPGGVYRERPVQTLREGLAARVGLALVVAGALLAGAVGWYVAAIVLDVHIVVSIVAVLGAVLVAGALGTAVLTRRGTDI